MEKADEAFLEPIERFRREQIGSAKEAKKKFDKETAKYCQNLERYLNLSIKKSETQLLEVCLLLPVSVSVLWLLVGWFGWFWWWWYLPPFTPGPPRSLFLP